MADNLRAKVQLFFTGVAIFDKWPFTWRRVIYGRVFEGVANSVVFSSVISTGGDFASYGEMDLSRQVLAKCMRLIGAMGG
jgi:hypothetical protein